MQKLIIIIIVALLVALTVAPLSVAATWYALGGRVQSTDVHNPKFEYARGLYDSCLTWVIDFVGALEAEAIDSCNREIAKVMAAGWYEQETNGFKYVVK
jgi:hypothetical protein